MKNHYRYLIIGGGPSGSAIAALLASSGEDVCIVEKKIFPREVLCGEFLSGEVIGYIREQGIFTDFLKLRPQRIKSFKLINSDGKSLFTPLGFDAYALKRSSFDKLLLDHAVQQGAHLITPAEVETLNNHNGVMAADIKKESSTFSLTADKVIAAYGKYNSLDKKLNRSFKNKRTGFTGVKFHLHNDFFNQPLSEEIQIYLADGIYCGINPVNNNQSTICFLSSPQRNPATPKDHIDYLRKNNKMFNQLFTQEFDKQLGDIKFYGTSNIYFGRREKHLGGIYFTGDASGVIAPLAGDGIGIALESAKLLANHLMSGRGTPDEYELSWNKLFSSRLRTAKFIQKLLLSSLLKNFAINTAVLFPSLPAYFITKTRSTNNYL